MLCSTLVTFCTLNITFYQRTLLGTSANQKKHYLKSYNKCMYTFQCTPCREGTGWMAKIMNRFGKYNLQ